MRIDRDAPFRFLRSGYAPDDWVAVLVKSPETGQAFQRIRPVSAVLAPRFQAWLRFQNATRCGVYISVNAVRPGRSRTRDAIAAIRHVMLDVDAAGTVWLDTLRRRSDLPRPSYVIWTSHERLHVLWRVRNVTAARAEALQRHLAAELATDPAATTCAQLTRLPGFINYRHTPPALVTWAPDTPSVVYGPDDFPHVAPMPSVARRWRPRTSPTRGAAPLARAREYLARVPPAIAGQHGDLHTFRVCCRIVRGFALADDEAVAMLRAWNARCEPPWSDAALRAKVRHARQYGRQPLGGLIDADRSANT